MGKMRTHQPSISRRRILQGFTSATLASTFSTAKASAEMKQERDSFTSPPNCYFAYPHSNGFLSDTTLLLAQQSERSNSLTYLVWDFLTGETERLFETSAGNSYGDFCERESKYYFVDNRKWISEYDLKRRNGVNRLISPIVGASDKMEQLVSVNIDGEKVLWVNEHLEGAQYDVTSARIMETDLRSLETIEVARLNFNADHQHYCPNDPNWIGFSHEGEAKNTPDRIWACHRTQGSMSVSQVWDGKDNQGRTLAIGHERWAYHAVGAIAVAFPEMGVSGLYFVDAISRRGRLISPSQTDWHCNISRDGSLAVVDTIPPLGQRFERDGRRISTIEVVSMHSGIREHVAISHAQNHPWHPHPHISPSNKFIVFNDFMADGFGTPSRVKVIRI